MATPIGNLADFTYRAVEILKQVECVVCEDTRRTIKLLNHYGIRKPMRTLFGPKEKRETPHIIEILKQSKSVALVTDAGTPGISDPGNYLVRQARENGIRVEAAPGASAVGCAVSVSGLCEKGFTFIGFLHRRSSRLKAELSAVKSLGLPVVFFESPYRIARTLTLAADAMGPDCECWVGRELTKRFEEHYFGKLGELTAKLSSIKPLGEFTVVVAP